MTFLHLSDLHLGKRVNEFSMLDDQRFIFDQILAVIDTEHPTAVLIAGDIYDKPVPPAAAVELFDGFLAALAERKLTVFLISGNHDSAERIAFGGRLMKQSGVHIAKVYDGDIAPVALRDEYGEIDVYLLPFIKPAHVAHAFEEETVTDYTDAMRIAIAHMNVDPARRNVLVTHQFVTGAATCESEELSVGGTDNVSAEVFEPFDYVALGHLHGPQRVSRDTIRYCGTPLKYSFSEASHTKSVTLVTMKNKGDVVIRTAPLHPLHDLCEIEGRYDELAARSFYEGTAYRDSYMHITLTDEEDIPDAIGKLRAIYPLLMKLDYNNTRTRQQNTIDAAENVQEKHPLTLFEELYELQNNQPLTDQQRALVADLIEQIWEGAE